MLDSYLSSTDVAECISSLIARNKLWSHKTVKLFFIVNSTAGCFNNKNIARQYYNIFAETKNEVRKFKSCVTDVQYEIFETEYQCHATEITKNIIEKITKLESENKSKSLSKDYIIVTAGGDGTSLEVQSALYTEYLDSLKNKDKKYDVIKNLAILRLPLGTGNDGTDGHYIEETFEILKSGLIYSDSKVLVAYTENDPPVETIKRTYRHISKYCDANRKAPWFAFNIASIGLDAFVDFVTNLVKSKFPGNLYHICVPVSGLFYSRVFKTGNTKIEMYNNVDDETPSDVYTGEIYLTAMGASGNRTYGGGQKVLPNFNNVCIASKVPLTRLIKENHKFVDGTHINSDIGNMFCADKIKVFYDKPLMLQCDGECYLLCKDHFPLIIEKRDSGFKTIRKID